MYMIRKDLTKNRLYLTLYGVISISEANKIKDKVVEEVSDLAPGFDVVNDISKLVSADEKAAIYLLESVKFMITKKVKRIVRIVGQSKTGLLLFAKYSPSDESLNIKYVPTLKEAEDYLSQP